MPVPYIIALIIGVVVVAVLAYWFISSGGKGANVGKEAECRARMLEWCVSQTSDVETKASQVCINLDTWTDLTKRKEFCKKIIPTWEEKK